MQLEAAASDCCDDPTDLSFGEADLDRESGQKESDDCDSCSDVAVLVELIGTKNLVKLQVDLDQFPPLDVWLSAQLCQPLAAPAQPSKAAETASMYPARLSCVVLRC